MFGGALVGQSAAELGAADVLSDTRHNWARLRRFSPGCQTDVSLSLSLFCPLIRLSRAMWRIPTCEDAGCVLQLPPTQLPTHILYHWHSPPPVVLTEKEGEVWRWVEGLKMLFWHYTWSTAASMIIAKIHYQKAFIANFHHCVVSAVWSW